MKIEMGESLFYSWLRHVKECQIVQTNWKTSPQWSLYHEEELKEIMAKTESFFAERYGYRIYRQTASLSQLLQQAECDALGISVQDGINKVFAVDVAFHEAGLNYGDREKTVMKIISKSLRTAMCIYGYLDTKEAEIIFASPKINKRILQDMEPCIEDMQMLMDQLNFNFRFRVIANHDFRDLVLHPLLMVSTGVADTGELFLRSYQMLQMFSDPAATVSTEQQNKKNVLIEQGNRNTFEELKIGKLAQIVMRQILESGTLSEKELLNLQDKVYSKQAFNLHFPLLVKGSTDFDRVRYYKEPVIIRETPYFLCSQWSERSPNNRQLLLKWIERHESKND